MLTTPPVVAFMFAKTGGTEVLPLEGSIHCTISLPGSSSCTSPYPSAGGQVPKLLVFNTALSNYSHVITLKYTLFKTLFKGKF